MSGAAEAGLAAWHAYMTGGEDAGVLRAMLADEAVFHSPVVHTPQVGADKVFAYLHAAAHVLGGGDFAYVRKLVDGHEAMLEFTRTVDGIHVNGVDIIRWNSDGQIIDFKVMVRPMKAMNKLWEMMAAQLDSAQAG
ncbi:MAG: nuclear transport factor 2 family protein [Sphingopyxis sp.]|nr:nuclear transport factor 2 family protein [Sphingopyxis sp.]